MITKKIEILFNFYKFYRPDDEDFFYEEWYMDYGLEIERYFKIDLGFEIFTDENDELTGILPPEHPLTFQEITGAKLDDTTLELVSPFLEFIAKTGYAHKIIFKKRITEEEKAPIHYFLYRLHDIFSLGIKKEINEGLFISLIIDGYCGLRENNQK